MMVYLAHPVGHEPQRSVNLQNCQVWFKWLIDNTDWCISLPWLAYIQTLDEGIYRDRGIRDDIRGLSRCDAIILCGSHISSGMRAELAKAEELGLMVIDLTGTELPYKGLEERLQLNWGNDRQARIRVLAGQLLDGMAHSGLRDVKHWSEWELISRKAEALAAEIYTLSDRARADIAQCSLPL